MGGSGWYFESRRAVVPVSVKITMAASSRSSAEWAMHSQMVSATESPVPRHCSSRTAYSSLRNDHQMVLPEQSPHRQREYCRHARRLCRGNMVPCCCSASVPPFSQKSGGILFDAPRLPRAASHGGERSPCPCRPAQSKSKSSLQLRRLRI